MQLNAMPILTFAAGTADFCQRTSPLETGLNVVYSILVSVCCLIGPSVIDKFNYWHFYKVRAHLLLLFLHTCSQQRPVSIISQLCSRDLKFCRCIKMHVAS